MSKGNRTRKNIRYWQYEGGYAQARELELRAVLEGYRLGHFRRNEVRVYAARLEHSARHPNARRLDLARILNCHSHLKGNRRLSERQINDAAMKLDAMLPALLDERVSQFESEGRRGARKPVARKVLQHIARGGATTVEALFYLAYFMTRIAPRAASDRLMANEHYARIRYCDFQAWTGVHRATQSRLMPRIMARGYLNSVEVRKRNENRYGQLFIDGPMTSLVRRRHQPHDERVQPRANGGTGGRRCGLGTSSETEQRSRQEGAKTANSGLEIGRFRCFRFAHMFAQTHDFWVHFRSSQVTEAELESENAETKKPLRLQGFFQLWSPLVTVSHK